MDGIHTMGGRRRRSWASRISVFSITSSPPFTQSVFSTGLRLQVYHLQPQQSLKGSSRLTVSGGGRLRWSVFYSVEVWTPQISHTVPLLPDVPSLHGVDLCRQFRRDKEEESQTRRYAHEEPSQMTKRVSCDIARQRRAHSR
jgi:hypothetical protein